MYKLLPRVSNASVKFQNMKTAKFARRAIPVKNRSQLEEITVAILGNANSGKSSMVGVLTNPILRNFTVGDFLEKKEIPDMVLDNGNGSARESILQYIHEQKTGRTSSITYNYMLQKEPNDSEKIISFVDLAGHEAYLKTTIRGVTSSYPDYALVCIEKSITKTTLEHMQLLFILNIPFAVVMSKIDIMAEDKLKYNIERATRYIKKTGRRPFIVKNDEDIKLSVSNVIVPIVLLSNKTGLGYDKLIPILNLIKRKPTKIIPNAFVIDSVYTVSGFGLVVCGIAGIEITKNDDLFLGPFNSTQENNVFIKAKVRTIHDDYRNFVDNLEIGARGCLCIKIDNKYKQKIRSGLVLVKSQDNVNPVKKFKAQIHVFNGTSCTITPGYNAFLNTGVVKSSVKFNKILKNDKPIYCTRGGETNTAELEFLRNSYCITPGEIFIFREGNTIGYGTVL
jgi:elongation factor 1-alpha